MGSLALVLMVNWIPSCGYSFSTFEPSAWDSTLGASSGSIKRNWSFDFTGAPRILYTSCILWINWSRSTSSSVDLGALGAGSNLVGSCITTLGSNLLARDGSIEAKVDSSTLGSV